MNASVSLNLRFDSNWPANSTDENSFPEKHNDNLSISISSVLQKKSPVALRNFEYYTYDSQIENNLIEKTYI